MRYSLDEEVCTFNASAHKYYPALEVEEVTAELIRFMEILYKVNLRCRVIDFDSVE